MGPRLPLSQMGVLEIARARSWIYLGLTALVVGLLVATGAPEFAVMLLLIAIAVAIPMLAQSSHRAFWALLIDSGIGLAAWWLFGPASGVDFVLLILAAMAGLAFGDRRREWLVGAVLLAEVSQIPLHFLAKSSVELPLFHEAGQVLSDGEFIAGVIVRLTVLVLASLLFGLVGRALRSSNERLEQLVRSKDEFVASVSHELRTPLTAVVGFAHVLAESKDRLKDGELDLLIEDIVRESRDVASIVDDLLVIARADIGRVTLLPEALDFDKEFAQVVAGLNASETDSILTDIGSARVWADSIRFRQVLRNLLTNAIRYGGTNVEVRSTTSGDTVSVVVEDDGPGINGNDPDRIFEPYVRAHENPTQPASVGLGLAVARSLARAMGGDVVYERVGPRTRFTWTVPASKAPSLSQV